MKIAIAAISIMLSTGAALAAPNCSAIPTSRDTINVDLNRAWTQKVQALNSGISRLNQIRDELISDKNWKIGDSGSVRELLTAIGLATRTTTDLIQDLIPFGADIKSATYAAIKNGADVGQLIISYQRHDKSFWLDAGLSIGSELSPVLTALNATNDLTKNIQDMVDLPNQLDEARRTFAEQLQMLDTQLNTLRRRLNDFEITNHNAFVDKLLERYNSARNSCEAVRAEDCAKERKAFINLMCWGDKGDALNGCLQKADSLCKG
jgi:hypothetical protein